jgi:drug/metabolite transporter (DMT)-like permease
VSAIPQNDVPAPAAWGRPVVAAAPSDARWQPRPGGRPFRQVGKTRHPWGVWLLVVLTLGIYGLYWYYKVNAEARDYEQTVNVHPGLSVLAVFIPIAGIVSFVRTGGRIDQAQRASGSRYRCSGLVGIILMLLAGVGIVYYQSQLNNVWDQHGNPEPGMFVS